MSEDQKPLVNRVASSGLKTVNLESYYPSAEIQELDLTPFLFKGLILKEKDFRTQLKSHDWLQFKGAVVCVHCTADAIVPVWAFMLISTYLKDEAKEIFQGNKSDYLKHYYTQILKDQDWSEYQDDRIVIKGCSNKPVPASAYMDLTSHLKPYAQSIMYGEPCSTVPIFKRPRKIN